MKKAASGPPACKKWPISPQKIVKKALAGLISLASATAVALFFFSSLFLPIIGVHSTAGVLLLLFGFCALILYSYEQAHFNRYFYDLSSNYLIIKEGVFTYGETTLPFSRIQDVYVDQDPLDQIFGLYDLHVSTASGQSTLTAHIDGLTYESSEAIKKELLSRLTPRQ
ncbi:MAG: PH domain-containing protein [Candidatus Micrarchaeota archaeon]